MDVESAPFTLKHQQTASSEDSQSHVHFRRFLWVFFYCFLFFFKKKLEVIVEMNNEDAAPV